MPLPRNDKLLSNARALRREMTREEKHLWYDFLRNYPAKIYRQRIVGNYILDFYCDAASLAIELDGSQHYDEAGKRADEERTQWMNQWGIEVVRFSNWDVMKHFEGVCAVIDQKISARSGDTSQALRASSPQGEPKERQTLPPLEGRCPEGVER